jgi:ABC-type sugar transport system ATPase subunit
VLVMCEGHVTGEFERVDADQETIMRAATERQVVDVA